MWEFSGECCAFAFVALELRLTISEVDYIFIIETFL